MILYRMDYYGDLLTFTNIEPYEGSMWKDKILKFEQDELELELQNPGNKRVTRYNRTSSEFPDVSSDYETNFLLYEEYMKSRINSR